MNEIGMEELSLVIDNLPNNKTAKLLEISNELWKHCVNKVMTDFGLSDSYRVHDELDQGEVFFLLLQRIFYDLLLCKVKRHEHLCRYKVDFKFIAKSGRIETSGKKTFFLTAGTFVDNTIWVRSSQASTQYILNIASEFFVINNISINNDKMVVISINQRVKNALLLINGLPILVVKKGLFKPSLAQTHKDVRFFSNIVLRKAIIDKQFCYLVLAVLQLIVSYCTQFSFVTSDVYHKWDIMIKKDLRAKASLPHDFPSEVLYHPSLYSLKPFEQFLVRLCVSPVNNFLVEVVKIFLENELSLVNNLSCAFYGSGNFLMSGILGIGTATATKEDVLSVLDSNKFSEVRDSLLKVWSNCIKVYTDGSLRCAGSVKIAGRVAIYFLAAKAGIEVKVAKLLSSTLTELQAVMLALKCVLFFCSVVLYSDNQSAIDVYISEAFLITPDFHNQCWIERLQIVNLLKNKNIAIKTKIEKAGLVGDNDMISGLSSSVVSMLLAGVVCMLGVIESFAVRFGRHKLCYFFSGLSGDAFVIIDV
ncbi:hypothetical protein G9A89_006809 [Geosiphon pyriformis]|nr:hypothetical protein G9A89_006809 [Geosiphon pyriformis]